MPGARQGVLIEEQGETYLTGDDGDSQETRALKRLQAGSCPYRVACGPRTGQKVLTLQGAKHATTPFKQKLCADAQGFSLHAAVRCNGVGQVVLTLKTPWRDGTTHLMMSPLAFMQRLAALVPRPRLHLIRFPGRRRG